jgi:Sulfotransferase family
VGQPKSGTTALYEALRTHPQLYLPDLKEPAFLASDLLAGVRGSAVRGRPRNLGDYISLFAAAKPEQRAGEATSLYLWSRTAATNMAALQPGARIVAILREPASFLRSLHLQLLQDHNESEPDLSKALALEGLRREGQQIPAACRRPDALLYSEYVCYVEQLCRYERVFPAEQMLVLIYDDFRADNEGTVKRVLRFLGVDDSHPIEVTQANPTVRLRSKQLDDIVKGVSTGRGDVMRVAKIPVKTLTSRRLRRGALRAVRRRFVYGDPRPADEDFMLELRRRFKGEVLALSEHLGRDLVSLWGYDDLD